MSPLDLHVLGTPPAFVLSQDQTLPFNPFTSFDVSLFGIFADLSLLRVSLSVSFSRFASLFSAVSRRRACIEYQISSRMSSTFFCFFAKNFSLHIYNYLQYNSVGISKQTIYCTLTFQYTSMRSPEETPCLLFPLQDIFSERFRFTAF